jgi:hypothetical protein
MPEFEEWDSFYLIVGGAAGALIGLQFVVMTLIAERPLVRAAEANKSFGTPTIVHFSAALLLASLLRMPWHSITYAAASWGLTGLSGLTYALIVARRMHKQTAYRADIGDWLFFVLMPLGAYAILVASAFVASSHTPEALFGVGATTLFLLFIGIHNAWDSVAYVVFATRPSSDAESGQDESSEEKKR